MQAQEERSKPAGLDLKKLGFNSPMEIINLLALIKVDGQPIIKEGRANFDEAVAQFDDIRHLLRFPVFRRAMALRKHLVQC